MMHHPAMQGGVYDWQNQNYARVWGSALRNGAQEIDLRGAVSGGEWVG